MNLEREKKNISRKENWKMRIKEWRAAAGKVQRRIELRKKKKKLTIPR